MSRMNAQDVARAQALWVKVREGVATEAERAEHEVLKARMRRMS